MLCRGRLILPQLFPPQQLPPSCAGDPKGTAAGGEDPDENRCNEQVKPLRSRAAVTWWFLGKEVMGVCLRDQTDN